MTTIEWRNGSARLIDQTLLPHGVEVVVRRRFEMVEAIRRLALRGAAAIRVALVAKSGASRINSDTDLSGGPS